VTNPTTEPGPVPPVPPVLMSLDPQAGSLGGSNGRYEKFLPDLAGLYRDEAGYAERLVADDGSPASACSSRARSARSTP
jgi:glucose-6-phosphate isomerase